ncbi:MAG: hypothetical protein K2X27_10175 [Candidatus Obscuribacterales bacterium]|nr:hypothetical protein [Candidatus Obscuribacterales bacterium]
MTENSKPRTNDAWLLFVISALSLYAELLLIRYITVEIHVFAYFKNLALMACFLGLGLGFTWTHRKFDWFNICGIIFLGLISILSIALALHWNALTFVNPFDFMLFGVGSSQEHAPSIFESAKCMLVMLLIFASTTFVFVGMGQEIGRLFEKFTPLKAYSINVAGALSGSALFSLLCALETPPGIWIIISGILFLLFKLKPSHFAILAFGFVHLFFLVNFIAGKLYGPDYVETLWSPYYRIDVVAANPINDKEKNRHWGFDLKVNYDTFQSILDCSAQNLKNFNPEVQKLMLDTFSGPWNAFHSRPKKVLILASGNGSDVAAALRNGAQWVDAVDIDPVLTRLGKTLHPEKPYLDPRVHLHVMDARTFLKNCKNKYDLIVFAYLDSHTAFSSLSSLRTDNYIFTVESYKEAMHLLNDRGLIYVSFISFKDWLWNRHTNALARASGMTPLASYTNNGLVGTGYMAAGPGLKYLNPDEVNLPGSRKAVDLNSGVELATDDWPFLFLPSKEVTATYIFPLAIILSFAALLIGKELKSGVSVNSNRLMFFLGMGFMLLEVRAIADLSLMFGSTWLVNSAVISTVLFMILLGNFMASKIESKYSTQVTIALLASILVSTLVKPDDLLGLGAPFALLVAIFIYLLPAAFASLLFALIFKPLERTAEALAFNIIGGIFGVSLEYLSMQFGVRFLGWLSIAIYAATLLFSNKPKTETGRSSN